MERECPPFTPVVRELPAFVPFIGPMTLERQSGKPIRLRLGANESAFGVSPKVEIAIAQSLEQVCWYGDPENHALRQALAEHHGVTMNNIAIASGIDELLGLLVRAYVAPGTCVITSRGTYPTFVYHALGYGARVCQIPYRGDSIDLQGLLDAARHENGRLVYLANPDNPSGTWRSASELTRLLDDLPAQSLMVLDEAYADFAPLDALPTPDAEHLQIVRCRTFSKAYGLAGLRIGYVIANREIISAIDRIRLHFGVNRVAQAAALAALADPAFTNAVIAAVGEGREEYRRLAEELGFRALPSATNFVTIDVGSHARALSLSSRLFESGVFVRVIGEHPTNGCLRVTVGTAEERRIFAGLFREIAKADRDHASST